MMKKLSLLLLVISLISDASRADVTVLGGLTRKIDVIPGDRVDGTIELVNNGDEVTYVDIYQTDYMFFADGRTEYGDPGILPRSNASWISFSPARVAIPAKSTTSVYYEMIVPGSEKLSGSYWSVVMIEPTADDLVPRSRNVDNEVSVGVKTVVRYAIQIITNIEGPGMSSIQVLDNRLAVVDGRTILQLDIENNGECWMSPSVWADLYSHDGTYVGRFESGRKRIFPSCSVRHQLDLSGVPKGSYRALMIIDNGDDRVFGADYEVRLEQ